MRGGGSSRAGIFPWRPEETADGGRGSLGGFFDALLTGWRLRCPACGEGRLHEGSHWHERCPNCNWTLTKPGEGDWLVTLLVAYTVGSVVLLLTLLLLYLFTNIGIYVQLVISSVLALVATAVTFSRARGAAIGILYFLRQHWEE